MMIVVKELHMPKRSDFEFPRKSGNWKLERRELRNSTHGTRIPSQFILIVYNIVYK